MFTMALLLAGFAMIAVIVATTTRRRPRAPESSVPISHSADFSSPAGDITPYMLAGVAADDTQPGGDTDCGTDSSGADSGGSSGPD